MFQSRTSSAFAKKLQKSKSAAHGMLSVFTDLIHVPCTSFARYSESKGPQYERKAAASRQSPTRLVRSASSEAIDPSHRVRSPPNPSTRFFARSSLTSSSSDSIRSRSLLLTFSVYFSRSARTRSEISFTFSCAVCSCFCLTASVFIAFLSFSRFGVTSLAMRPYTSIARTHMHSDFAAFETPPTTSGSKSGCFVYFDTLFKMPSVSESLSKLTRCMRKLGSPSCFFASSQLGVAFFRIITASIVVITACGGLAYAFTSAMSFLFSSSSAFCAASSAGSALSRSACASSAIALHSTSSFEIFSDSTFTWRGMEGGAG